MRCIGTPQSAARHVPALEAIWPSVYQRPADDAAAADVDEDLYGGLLGDDDRRLLQRLREATPQQLAQPAPAFDDRRLDELLFRYRARNFPDTLTDAERGRWEQHRAERLLQGMGGAPALEQWLAHIDSLIDANDDERSQHILGELVEYATGIAPEAP